MMSCPGRVGLLPRVSCCHLLLHFPSIAPASVSRHANAEVCRLDGHDPDSAVWGANCFLDDAVGLNQVFDTRMWKGLLQECHLAC